jgi:hypothetical protein
MASVVSDRRYDNRTKRDFNMPALLSVPLASLGKQVSRLPYLYQMLMHRIQPSCRVISHDLHAGLFTFLNDSRSFSANRLLIGLYTHIALPRESDLGVSLTSFPDTSPI